ncbi:MAG: SUMF1/EgtB/PvdO family nonheme iron enzyme [Polyangia bacterium]
MTIGEPQQAAQVAEALSALAAAAGDSLRLLATVRSDFLARVATLPGLGDDINRAVYLLRPMGPDKLREAVTGPALLKGVTFESDELVDELVSSTAHTDGGLPLLQFALAELWDVRIESQITRAALQSIGGVAGALARHADHVVSALPTEPRTSARRILMALVTLEGTRARRNEEELTHADAGAKVALEALVRGRLLVARDTPEGPAYEVAHEALIKGWQSLRKWLDEHQEARAVKQRLETAAAEWQRLGRTKEALWSARQLAEIALLEQADISPRERTFVESSQRRETQKRRLRRAVYVAVPVFLMVLYGVVQLASRRNLLRQVNALRDQGGQIFLAATEGTERIAALRRDAFAAFDGKDRDRGEELWKQSREAAVQADRKFAQAANTLESALALDPRRDDIRDRLAEVLYQRALAAERDRQERLRDELLARLAVYDRDGRWRAKWDSPATLKLTTTPADATAELASYTLDASERWVLAEAQAIDRAAGAPLRLAPGSYLLTLAAPGYVPIRYPILVQRDEALPLQLELPRAAQVPPGYVYVPPGRFLFGFGQEDQLRKIFFGTAPLHQVVTDGYVIAKHEVTFAEWIEYLKALPSAERKERLPRAGSGGLVGGLELRELPGGRWRLVLQPKDKEFSALDGEPIVLATRERQARQDWLRFPVGGVSCPDAKAYADWLAATGRLPGARLCTELEWERATRGADDRTFPHAEQLRPEDANYDETYGRQPEAYGPDEVGAHPRSRSPFGVDDVVGNHFEWTQTTLSTDPCVMRGGSYQQEAITNFAMNRNQVDPSHRALDLGLRICAPLLPPR